MDTLYGTALEASIVRIREGSEADAEWFFEVEEQTTWENLPRDCEYDRETMRTALCATHRLILQVPGNVFFIAEASDMEASGVEASGVRAGLLWFGPKRNLITGRNEGWIYNVTVLPEFRGRGLAKMLLRHAEEYARTLGYDVVGLSVATHNEIARGLYHRVGFDVSNVIMRKPLIPSDERKSDCIVCENEQGQLC